LDPLIFLFPKFVEGKTLRKAATSKLFLGPWWRTSSSASPARSYSDPMLEVQLVTGRKLVDVVAAVCLKLAE
jgi:hypothetical protein